MQYDILLILKGILDEGQASLFLHSLYNLLFLLQTSKLNVGFVISTSRGKTEKYKSCRKFKQQKHQDVTIFF